MPLDQPIKDTNQIPPPPFDEDEELGASMTFLEHLTELRERLIRILVALVIGFTICFMFGETLLRIIHDTIPENAVLQELQPAETLLTMFKVSFVGAIFIAFPVLFYEIWMFVAPGLYLRERRIVLPLILSAWVCFILGGLFCYFFVFRFTLQFLASLAPDFIQSQYSIASFTSFMIRFILAFGLVFEEPVVIILLARIGIVNQEILWKFFPYACIGIVIIAAVITPPDPFSQMACAIPLLVLYLVSIFIVRFIQAKEIPAEEDEEA